MIFYGINVLYPLVSSNMAGKPTEWRFLARKSTDFYGPFSRTPCLMTGGYVFFFFMSMALLLDGVCVQMGGHV